MLNKYIVICLANLAPLIANAQNIPDDGSQIPAPTLTPKAVNSPYTNGIKLNYITSRTATQAINDLTVFYSSPNTKVLQEINYFDGLGRQIQNVKVQTSPVINNGANLDIITVADYDEFGRAVYNYLPFATPTQSSSFRLDAFQQQSSFNQTYYSGEQFYYGKTIAENSSAGRTLKSFAPGNSWIGTDRAVTSLYNVNASTDQAVYIDQYIGIFHGNHRNLINTSFTVSMYNDGELLKTVVTDENGNKTEEFKNRSDQVVLKRNWIVANTSSATTAYLYDKRGLLRVVVQPNAFEALKLNSWTFTEDILKEGCFIYDYDDRGRMTAKKVPGAGWTYMVYDNRNRLVLSQDENLSLRSSMWLYNSYDNLNRLYETGLIVPGSSTNMPLEDIQDLYNNNSSVESLDWTKHWLTKTTYENYSMIPWAYDVDYPQSVGYTTLSEDPFPSSASVMNLGLPTYSETKVLENPDDIDGAVSSTATYYDSKGRALETFTKYANDVVDVSFNHYNFFNGRVLHNLYVHSRDEGTKFNKVIVESQYSYDFAGRQTKTEKRADNASVAYQNFKTISEKQYDQLGVLIKKQLGNDPNTNLSVESQQFSYNIRGWLRGININATMNDPIWFRQVLNYDWGFHTNQYNGNISGITWQSKGDGIQRAYGYGYDGLNRLITADFVQGGSGSWNNNYMDFSGRWQYDRNGNILSQQQYGFKLTGSMMIDDMNYNYADAVTNQLKGVRDLAANQALGDFNDKNSSNDDYRYDASGNLTSDANKDIASIGYNHLNLPQAITVTGKGTIAYAYDATGVKFKKTVTEGTKQTVTTYMGPTVYEHVDNEREGEDILQFISDDEGRIRKTKDADGNDPAVWSYDYFIKDHLGNVRMTLTDEQKTDAYPAATMETATATIEESYYSNLPDTRVDVPGNYPQPHVAQANEKVAKLNGKIVERRNIGPAILLKVMSGDKFNIKVDSWYDKQGSEPAASTPILDDIANALTNGISVITQGHPSSADLQNSGLITQGVGDFLNTVTNEGELKPLAYLNWILLDEQFKFVANGSGFDQVPDDSYYENGSANPHVKEHIFTNMPVTKNGYLYIFVTNQTPNIDVFFDNLQVTHVRGPLVAENGYYPFGLEINSLNSKALNFGGSENKKKFQNQEFNSDLGIDGYEFKYRMDDPQIGRFWQVDPLSEKYVYNSSYAFSENKVTTYIELEGLEAILAHPGVAAGLNVKEKGASSKWSVNPKPKESEGPTVTLVLTSGYAGADLELLGAKEIELGGSVDQIDIIGVRDNKFVFMGENNDGTKTSRDGAGISFAGFGYDELTEVTEKPTLGPGQYEEKRTTTTKYPGVSSETTSDALGNTKSTKNYIGFDAKFGFGIIGIEASVKIPVPTINDCANPKPAKYGPVDNTFVVRPKVL